MRIDAVSHGIFLRKQKIRTSVIKYYLYAIVCLNVSVFF